MASSNTNTLAEDPKSDDDTSVTPPDDDTSVTPPDDDTSVTPPPKKIQCRGGWVDKNLCSSSLVTGYFRVFIYILYNSFL